MKIAYAAIICCAISILNNPVFSQQSLTKNLPKNGKNQQCISDLLNKELAEKDSIFRKKLYQKEAEKINSNSPNSNFYFNAEEVFNIPIVVHIIHLGESVGSGTNISDAQVISAINDLNNKFGSSNTGVNTNIEFCLAKRTPTGGATNGIVRVDGSSISNYSQNGIITDETIASSNDSLVKAASIWPNDQYYNIWVVSEINNNNGGSGTQGYAYFAGAPAHIDGTVIIYNAMGFTNTLLQTL